VLACKELEPAFGMSRIAFLRSTAGAAGSMVQVSYGVLRASRICACMQGIETCIGHVKE
jgi:hypothetical protein